MIQRTVVQFLAFTWCGSHLPVTLGPDDMTLSSGLCKHLHKHGIHSHKTLSHTHTHINKKKINVSNLNNVPLKISQPINKQILLDYSPLGISVEGGHVYTIVLGSSCLHVNLILGNRRMWDRTWSVPKEWLRWQEVQGKRRICFRLRNSGSFRWGHSHILATEGGLRKSPRVVFHFSE